MRRLDILRLPNRDAEVHVVRDMDQLEHSELDVVDPAYEDGSQEVVERSWG